jgi:hypothetical protein
VAHLVAAEDEEHAEGVRDSRQSRAGVGEQVEEVADEEPELCEEPVGLDRFLPVEPGLEGSLEQEQRRQGGGKEGEEEKGQVQTPAGTRDQTGEGTGTSGPAARGRASPSRLGQSSKGLRDCGGSFPA